MLNSRIPISSSVNPVSSQILERAARCTLESLEKRRLLCGLSHEFLIDAPQWSDAIEMRARDRLAGEGPESPDAVSIEWSNRGMANDNFAATFGTIAENARRVVDKALEHWARVITSWNRTLPNGNPDPDVSLQVNISIGGTGFGGAGAPAAVAPADGRPRTGSFTIGAGNPIAFPDPNDSNGWYIDPNPDDHAEFNGPIVNAYAGNGAGLGPDLYSLAVIELTHVLGLISDKFNNGGAWENYRLESSGFITNTGIADNADGGGNGVFWVFDGPSVDHLMTSFNSGDPNPTSWGNIVHSAGPGGNTNFAGKNWRGAADTGNANGNAGRNIPDFAMAHMLADAYGYSIREPWEFDTFHYLLNRDTGELLIRGGRVNTSSDDVITLGIEGDNIFVSVDVGNDVPGTGSLPGAGNLPPFRALFPGSEVTSITIAALDGNDIINIENLLPNIPVLVDGGFDNDTIHLSPTHGNLNGLFGALTVQGNTGDDTLILHDTANAAASTFQISSFTLDRDVIPAINYSGFDIVNIDAGAGSSTFNVTSLINVVTLNLNAGGGNDTINIGAVGGNAEAVDGTINLVGQDGSDTLNWNDTTSSSSGTYTLTSNSITRTGTGTVFFDTQTIELNAATGANTINVNSTANGSSTTVNAGGGADTINVGLSAATLLAVNGGDANDIINLNNPGGLSGIVVINGNASTGSGDTLNYNAQNSSANDVYEISSGAIERTGNVDVFHGTFEQVVINAGIGSDRFDVETTAAGTTYTVNANIGTDVMNVTLSSGNLDTADGPIVFNGDAGSDSVTLWDNLNAASGVYTVTNTQATRAGFGGLTYGGLEAFTLSASTVGDTINLNSTAAGTSYALNGNGGNDGFRIANATRDLTAIVSSVSINGGAGTSDGVVLFDSLSSASQTSTITSNQVIHPVFGPFQYSNMESLVFEGASGNDIIDVMSTDSTTPVTARGNAGDDQFRLANGNLNTLVAMVHVEGGAGVNTAVLRDHSTVENDGFTVTATQITHPNFGGLVYSDLTTLTVEAGFGNNTFTVNSTSSVTDIRLKGNAGNDFYEVNSTNSLKPLIIDAGGGTTNVINSIPATSAGLVIENNQTLQSLTLIGDVRASFAGSGASTVTQFVTVLSGARFNLGTNALIVDYSGSSPLSTISSLVTSGYNGGAWNGAGINSSAAAASGNSGIGIAEATDLFSSFPASFAGRSIDNTSVLLTHTLYGDANLDKQVNLTDFNRLAANFGQSSRRWIHGDGDYNGTVNLTDFNRLAANFGQMASGPDGGGPSDADDELDDGLGLPGASDLTVA